jgi:hypothetical protein
VKDSPVTDIRQLKDGNYLTGMIGLEISMVAATFNRRESHERRLEWLSTADTDSFSIRGNRGE